MSSIIDRRKNNSGKSTGNREKFLKRIKGQIKKSLPDVISNQSIKDIGNNKGKIKVPIKGINEPSFRINPKTGKHDRILPGNKEFSEGDKIPKPEEDGGDGNGGRKGSKDPSTHEDEYAINLSREEFLEYFLEDLELPNLIKKDIKNVVEKKLVRAGFTPVGPPSRLNIKRSFKQSLSRQIGVKGSLEKKIKDLEEEYAKTNDASILEEIERLQKNLKVIPFLDKIDLKFNAFDIQENPSTQAVMFCVMDVSGSMTEYHKDIAKRFFTLLYLFLTKSYQNIDIVFIRHHTEASEVNEEDFFNSRESGGTLVLPSLELVNSIIDSRYSDGNWNVFCCQATDGDVWGDEDAIGCMDFLNNTLLKKVQYMPYIEIFDDSTRYNTSTTYFSDLWKQYELISNEKFVMKKISEYSQIWPVFQNLFSAENK
jgi:uncharacterized sporulation protein YeaH/YhbH (DUF444 family)